MNHMIIIRISISLFFDFIFHLCIRADHYIIHQNLEPLQLYLKMNFVHHHPWISACVCIRDQNGMIDFFSKFCRLTFLLIFRKSAPSKHLPSKNKMNFRSFWEKKCAFRAAYPLIFIAYRNRPSSFTIRSNFRYVNVLGLEMKWMSQGSKIIESS